jgi:hypothetical protein
MGPQPNDSSCKFCHAPSGGSLAVADANLHPLNNPAINPGVDFAITAMGGGSGAAGHFVAGDKPTITFTLKDDSGVDVPLRRSTARARSWSPHQQLPARLPVRVSQRRLSGLPVDFSRRLVAASTSNKGSMSKVDDASAPSPWSCSGSTRRTSP